MDKRLAHGDRFRQAAKELESRLQAIDRSSSDHPNHTESLTECERCKKRKSDVAKAYYNFCVDAHPESWTAEASRSYLQQMERISKGPESLVDDLHALFRQEFENYLRSQPYAREVSLANETTIEDHAREILNVAQNGAPNPDAAAFIADLQNTHTREKRAQIYIKYYCTPSWNDSVLVKNFKMKYSRMFEQLVPYDEVVAAMRKEANATQNSRLSELRSELADMEMAHKGHLRDKARKEQKMREREPSPGVVQCNVNGCANEINLARPDVIECAVCEWMDRSGGEKGRAFYCCMEHAQDDFEEHASQDHLCCMGGRCLYYPRPGPPEESNRGGLCQDCRDEEFSSYFCSQDCYYHNLEIHREDFHMGKGIHNDSTRLDIFTPPDDVEITRS